MDRFDDRVSIVICGPALDAIFDECDRYDSHETGGRLVGTFQGHPKRDLVITLAGVIEAGPKASRSATSFFQDGDHQETIFRRLEKAHPEIEHLGNWHTHHMNGYPTLSGGDRATYRRIVNHSKHNTDFFYALLVTAKSDERYDVKHFMVYRGDPQIYEIAPAQVRVVDQPALWPMSKTKGHQEAPIEKDEQNMELAAQRGRDSQFFSEFQPSLRPFLSKKHGGVYWRGRIALIDDSAPEVIVHEVPNSARGSYRVAVTEEPFASTQTAHRLSTTQFNSAREAIMSLERELNREIFRRIRGGKGANRS